MEEVRRESDDELCGFVARSTSGWQSLTVFGAVIGEHEHRDDAVAQMLEVGLAVLAERWQLRHRSEDEGEVVLIQEADPTGVTLALGYYSLPGVPTKRVSRDDLLSGEWLLSR
jgi:hypothetical protein